MIAIARKAYNSILTADQWGAIAPLFGHLRNFKWPKRELIDALLYVLANGIKWRNPPHDFPHWKTVYSFYSRAAKSGLWMNFFLVEITRQIEDRKAQPSYAIIDSQCVKTISASEERGMDGDKKIKGRKRHIVVDTMGNLFSVKVHAANIHDRGCGIWPAETALANYPEIQK